MIQMPNNIADALEIEPIVRDIHASWYGLTQAEQVQESLENSDFYQMFCRCKQIIRNIDDYKAQKIT